ncbi:Tetratricopeptide repeat [Thermus arciformis]|uniref:Tetratricopeptide repeat n=1 Tax=Thermus arciformis TaxID=482827 RepID=A0A1G7IDC4_9DEIN|nr:tetratricopeptide repeat protein [Thermus arciformis]SDF10645.1 Tetratricopeptide repeat [Thermus arciformis]
MRRILGLAWILSLLALAQGAEEYYARCERLYGQGALESAQATCELALVEDPGYRPALRLLVRIHLEKGDLAQAEAYLSRLGEDPEALVLRGRLLLLKGKAEEALGLPLPPTPEGRLLRALALRAQNRLEEALREAQGLPPTPEARLLLARIHLALGNPEAGLAALGSTLEERVERGRLLFLAGRPEEAVALLEEVLPQTSGRTDLQREALSTLVLAYFGQGDWARGQAALGQLAGLVNLPALFLARVWPWLLALGTFLVLVVLGESRIEPLRTVEVVEDPLPGPGSLYLAVLLALALALGVALFLGKALFANLLALFTPYQKAQVLPGFFLAYGLFLFAGLLLWQRRRLPQLLGPLEGWVEGFWVGPALVLALWAYGLVRPFLGFPTLPLHLLVFLGLALMEPFFRGLAPWVFKERYRELAPYLSALFFALAVPGPTLLFLLLGAGLLWAKERAGSVLGLALGWVVAGVALALFPSAWLRRF